jgi:hypothetical protein
MHTIVKEVDILSVEAVWDETAKKMIRTEFLRSGNQGLVKISVSYF